MNATSYSDPPELQFRAALAHRDIVTPAQLIADGKLHRCDAVGRGGKGDAAYVLHLDGVSAGGFQNWRDGIGWQDWRADIGRSLSPAEEEEHRRRAEAAAAEREADQARRQAEAAAARAHNLGTSCPRLQRASLPDPKAHCRASAPGFIADRCS